MTPSLQQDADIDIPLPTPEPHDQAGMIYGTDGTGFNYFRMKVEICHIEGKTYDLLYSTRGRKATVQERANRVGRLSGLLAKWKERIPPQLDVDHIIQMPPSGSTIHMASLYHSYLKCLVMVHGIYSYHADWVHRISAYSRLTLTNNDTTRTCQTSLPPLPMGWSTCVEASRSIMRLFKNATRTDYEFWLNSCGFFSALVILMANTVLFPGHEYMLLDQALSDQAMQVYNTVIQTVPLLEGRDYHRLHVVVKELHETANTCAENFITYGVQVEGVFDSLDFETEFMGNTATPFGMPNLGTQ